MAKAEASIHNLVRGELAPKMRGRIDLPVYFAGLEVCRNFITEAQGPARYRNGFKYVFHTRRNKIAHLIKFQFSTSQAYILEFTDQKMRVYKDDGIVLQTAKNITGATQANPCVITSVAHGFINGDEVYITGVVGMTELNGKFFLVANKTADTFELTDQDGNNINATAFTAYSSAGTVAGVFGLTTPYLEGDNLFLLKTAQNADVMYIVHPYYEPRKLTRTGHAAWTLGLFSRTSDPFLSKQNITGATQANPCVITATSHGFVTGDKVIIQDVGGMTQLNGRWFTVTFLSSSTFSLDGVDSTAYDAYTSGGYASNRKLLPGAVTLYESRMFYGVIENEPLAFKASRAPDNNGITRYDDFTNGTNADHAVENTIASEDESGLQWLRGNDKFLAAGAFSGVFKITGDRDDEAISPESIKVKRVSAVGSSSVTPLNLENAIIYAERQNLTVRSFEYDALLDAFSAKDLNLVSDEITKSGVKQLAYQAGRPDIVWVCKNNGELLGLTFKLSEDIVGWHLHKPRNSEKFISVAALPRTDNYDQLWAVVERTINGVTRRYVEYMEDPLDVPQMVDYFTDDENEDSDKATHLRALYEAQKQAFHLDSGLSYDGSATSVASVTVTPGAVSGNDVVFTAGASIFKASDVGREIWKKPVNGVGTGRAKITAYTSPTQVTCDITEAFDSASAMTAGNWYFTTASVSGLDHLTGETVKVIADGAVHSDEAVVNGAISLDYQASVIHVGFGYKGILKTMNLEVGGTSGPSPTKLKNLHKVGIRFIHALGTKFGTDFYRMKQIEFRTTEDVLNRPAPLFSGDKVLSYEDKWEEAKHVIIFQEVGLPCSVQLIIPYATTSNR